MFAYLGRLPDNQRAEMYSILTDEHALYDLEDYFMENGFVNSETYPNFQLFTQNTLNIELTQEQDIIETEVREAETEVREVETEVREEEELVFMRNKETFTDMHTV